MGLSASQARFLQLTARRSDLEYETQQINFQRLQLSQKLTDASTKYQDEMNDYETQQNVIINDEETHQQPNEIIQIRAIEYIMKIYYKAYADLIEKVSFK